MIIKLGAGRLSMGEIARFTGGFLIGSAETEIEGICTDSREAGPGILFVALRGERTDGHDYIPLASRAGCRAILAERSDTSDSSLSEVIVPDSQRALSDIARGYRDRVSCRRICVTGSVGKTTTREYIAAVTSEKYITHKTKSNYNSLIGMPLTLCETPENTEISVLELAMSGLYEIEELSQTARPDIAAITNIGTAHMEMLGSRENICRAKFEILAGIQSDGILILNGDEPMMLNYPKKPEKTLYVSIKNSRADYVAHNIRQYEGETVFDISAGIKTIYDIRIPALGNHNVLAAVFAWAVGEALGIDEEEICRGLMKYRPADMRQKIYKRGRITIVEDCYNASPESMRAAVDVLCGLKKSHGCRAVALLGDMRELGMNTEMYHRSVGAYAAECGVDKLLTLGSLSRYIAAGALSAGMREDDIFVNLDENTYEATAAELTGLLRPGRHTAH